MRAQHEIELPSADVSTEDLAQAVLWMMPIPSAVTSGHLQVFAERLANRERQLLVALTELAAVKEELESANATIKHYEEKPFYTRNIFENDAVMVCKDFSAVTAEDFVNLFEYSEKCKCQCCAEIRYILSLREALTKGAA
jgi:hypothetical protein